MHSRTPGFHRPDEMQRLVTETQLHQVKCVKIFDKLRAGHSPVVVGYLGGSITAGVGATDPESTSWRALTTRWFRERFPGVEVRECDASLRGTGSDLAVSQSRRGQSG